MLKFIALTFLVFHEKILITSQHPFKSQTCGQRYIYGFRRSGLNEAYSGEFPWMVSIMTHEYGVKQHVCGGSLIHPQLVLTSAQCVQSFTMHLVRVHPKRTPSELTARVGAWDLQTTRGNLFHQDRNISKIIYHESVNHSLSNFEFNDIDDFALLVLAGRVSTNYHVQTICLPDPKLIVDKNRCFVSGWAERFSDKLQRFNQTIVNYDTCQIFLRETHLGAELNLTRRFICAIESEESFCYNFEGNPLVCPLVQDSSRYVQIGTFSWVTNCGAIQTPNLYGSVSHIRSWIDQQVEDIDKPSFLYSSVENMEKSVPIVLQICGRHAFNSDSDMKKSNATYFSRFPWMVLVLEKHDERLFHRCTGSLIHPQMVLTAAHCIDGLKSSEILIRAGKWGMQKFIGFPYQQSQLIYKIIVSNNHDGSSISNGSALLFLTSPFTLTQNINTICLPDSTTTFDKSRCFVSMWKDNFFNESIQNSRLAVHYTDCGRCLKTYFGQQFKRNNNFICIDDNVGWNSSNYMPGSPLVCPTYGKEVHYIQVGSMLRSDICGKHDKINIFANITEFRSWIDDQMKKFNFNISSYVYSSKNENAKESETMLYIITPANGEHENIPDIARLAQTLMILKNIHWLVIEVAEVATPQLTDLLRLSGSKFEHLTVKMPNQYKHLKSSDEMKYGVSVNRGLEWIRAHVTSGVICFIERGTVYDVEIFEEMRATEKISMFPVGYETKSGVSSPILRKGKFDGYYDEWRMNRKYPVSMSGFALNVKFFRARPKAEIPLTPGYQEDGFIKNLEPFETSDIQFLASNCTRILVWNTLGTGDYSTEPLDMELFNDTNIVELKKQIF